MKPSWCAKSIRSWRKFAKADSRTVVSIRGSLLAMNFSRRQAITAGIASFGAAALDAQEQAMKIGVIGLGNRGNNAHVHTLKQLSEAKITAICDIQPDLMKQINDGLPSKAATYVDYRELIKDPNVGIVVVATPGYLHREMALAALRAGKDLMLEKPLAL